MATLLKDKNNVRIIDAFLENSSYQEVSEQIKEFHADVVIMDTANTYLFWRCCYLNIDVIKNTIRFIRKKSRAKCIICGPHGTQDPVSAFKTTNADFIVRGEPDLVLPEFINENFNKELKGISTRSNPENGIATVKDMDSLPMPAFDLLEMKKYRGHAWLDENTLLNHGALVEYSRGCPYYCSFCFRNGFREKLRVKSAEHVIQEIAYMKEHFQISYYFFIDEIFNVDNENFRKLLDGLKMLNIKYGCQCRPDVMTKEMLDLMSASGCIYIEYGLETINKEARKRIDKNLDIRKVFSIINYSKKVIPNIVYNFLDFSTIDMILMKNKDKSENANGELGIYSDTKALENIVFFPGTQLFTELKEGLNTKKDGWDLSIRLYWLSVKLKQNKDKSIYNKKIWKMLLLHFPMRIIKILMSCRWIYTPLEISYGHQKEEG